LEPLSGQAGVSVTLPEQSAFVIQAFALALAGGAERIAFNKMRNDYPHPEAIEPYGLLRADGSRRPAFAAFQMVSTYFAGVSKTSWLQLGDVYIVTLDRAGQTTTVLWNTAATPTLFDLNAIAPEAILVNDQGNQQRLAAENGLYSIELPGAPCSNGLQACFIGGSPRLIVETGSPDQRIIQIPLAATPTPAPVTANTPTPEVQSLAGIDTPPPPPTLTPTPTVEMLTALADEESSLGAQNSGSPLIAALPDPSLGGAEPAESVASNSTTPAAVPPVTIATILRPERIFWLFIIGLIVFTVSYGVQVVIWYRLRR
jgi:hypothetical protein